MREVTNLMINEFKIKELKMDSMGYVVDKKTSLQFHHLIVPKKDCKRIPENGYIRANGIILSSISHEYLHKIESYERELFLLITKELIDENIKGCIDKENLIAIRNYLDIFEREYKGLYTSKGKPIIKKEYISRRVER